MFHGFFANFEEAELHSPYFFQLSWIRQSCWDHHSLDAWALPGGEQDQRHLGLHLHLRRGGQRLIRGHLVLQTRWSEYVICYILKILYCVCVSSILTLKIMILLGVHRLISVYRWTHPEVNQGSFSCQGLLLRKTLRYENQGLLVVRQRQRSCRGLATRRPRFEYLRFSVASALWRLKKGGLLRISIHIKPWIKQ